MFVIVLVLIPFLCRQWTIQKAEVL